MLRTENLSKTYHRFKLDLPDFHIDKGDILGLVGNNGAGKTTTIEIIEGITPATAGTIRYRGRPRDAAFNNEIGIQFQHTTLLDFLTVKETLATFQTSP